MTRRRGERHSDGSRETSPYRGFDHTSDTGTLPMTRPMPREVTDERSESLGRRTLASVSRETVQWARWHDGITATDTALVPVTDWLHVAATGTAEAGQPVPREQRAPPPSRIIQPPRALECTSQHQETRFPVELQRRASQPKPALHERHQMLAQAPSGERSISAPTAEAPRDLSGVPHVSRETTRAGGTYGLRFHRGAHNCGQPLSDGGTQSTELCTTVDKLRSALWPAPMAREHAPVRG